MPLHPRHIEKDHAFAGIFDARRKRLGYFEQRFLRGALALGIAAAGDELRQERARLRQREAGLDSLLPRPPRGSDDMGVAAVPFHDTDRLVEQIGLAAQPRREDEHRYVEAGQAGHEAFRVWGVGSGEWE
jgi:hypothetical protein